MFPAEPAGGKKGKKGRKSASAGDEAKGGEELPAPADVLVDAVIGFLEKGTAYLRAAANQAFALLSGAVAASTIDLVLTVSASYACFRWRASPARASPLPGAGAARGLAVPLGDPRSWGRDARACGGASGVPGRVAYRPRGIFFAAIGAPRARRAHG